MRHSYALCSKLALTLTGVCHSSSPYLSPLASGISNPRTLRLWLADVEIRQSALVELLDVSGGTR
jgi:hypothetical protein